MKQLETDWWTLELPPEWEAEQDEELIVIEDEDGVSCLELSSLVREHGEVGDADLAEFSRELRDAGASGAPVTIGPWRGEVYQHDDAEFHYREWFLRCGAIFVYAAYHCLPEHRGFDDAAIDEILATLEPKP